MTASIPMTQVLRWVRIRNLFRWFNLTVVASLLVACSPGRRPFVQFEVCLQSGADVNQFVAWFQRYAAQERAVVLDGSAEISSKLEGMGASDLKKKLNATNVVSISASTSDGKLWSATNVGMPGYQFVLSISDVGSTSELSALADSVDREMQMRWRINRLPGSVGAKGIVDCMPSE
jgi:hypothetical protein